MLVHEAALQDHQGGKLLLWPLRGRFPRLQHVWAESASRKGGFLEWVKETLGWDVEMVKHPWSGWRGVWVTEGQEVDGEKIRPSGFPVLPWRGIVERTLAWLAPWRRLSTDEERLPRSEDAGMSVAMIPVMVRRLANASLTAQECPKPVRAA